MAYKWNKFNTLYIVIIILLFGILYSSYKISATQIIRDNDNKQVDIKEQSNRQIKDLQDEVQRLMKENEELKKKLISQGKIMIGQSKEGTHQENIPSTTKIAYLTFDDGPSKNSDQILNILKQNNIKGTFFVIGKKDKNSLRIYRRIIEEGHSIGNHTYSHNYSFIYSSPENYIKDFNKLQILLKEVVGVTPSIARFPGGSYNLISNNYGGKKVLEKVKEKMNEEGITYFDWNVDSTDAMSNHISDKEIYNQIISQASHKKVINILMHDSNSKVNTVKALPKVINKLKEMGFEFQAVNNQSKPFHFRK